MKKIIFTGGAGRFANVFRSIKNRYKIEYPSKAKLNIEKFDSINNYQKAIKIIELMAQEFKILGEYKDQKL